MNGDGSIKDEQDYNDLAAILKSGKDPNTGEELDALTRDRFANMKRETGKRLGL